MFDVSVGDTFHTASRCGVVVKVLRLRHMDPVDAAVCRAGDGTVFYVTPWMLELGVAHADKAEEE